MKKEQLFEVFGEIDETYVNKARQTTKKIVLHAWMKWGGIAACLCLVLVCAFVVLNLDNDAWDYAETVIYNNAKYVICGEGEVSILKECGLPAVITEDLAGKHLAFLEQAEKNTYHISVSTDDANVTLFEYAPQPNENVYIVCIDGKYFAAIRKDSEGYHGL